MKPITPEYIAGIFDADGTMGIYRSKQGVFRPMLAIASGHKPTLEEIKEFLGLGCILRYQCKGVPSGNKIKPNRDSFRFQTGAWEPIGKFLDVVQPHLREKQSQSILMRQAIQIVPGKRLKEAERATYLDAMQKIADQLKIEKGKVFK